MDAFFLTSFGGSLHAPKNINEANVPDAKKKYVHSTRKSFDLERGVLEKNRPIVIVVITTPMTIQTNTNISFSNKES